MMLVAMKLYQIVVTVIIVVSLQRDIIIDAARILYVDSDMVDNDNGYVVNANEDIVHTLIRKWAPLVFLAPGEQFYPSSVPYFLDYIVAIDAWNQNMQLKQIPIGNQSVHSYLTTKKSVEELLLNTTSFLYGQNPQKERVPIYVAVNRCESQSRAKPTFHATYWFFYPFNQGKRICTVFLDFLGPVPIPNVFNQCLGENQIIGNHIGDWEHISLYFENSTTPISMYVSTHDAGVYYKYDPFLKRFVYTRQEIRNGIIVQKPKFPTYVHVLNQHPILFAAKGSHGFWSKPGKNLYVRVPKLYDETGKGVPWKTWENLEILDPPGTGGPEWMNFLGKWGNAKTNCRTLKIVGIELCQLTDGPTGIPMKRPNFICPRNNSIQNF